MSVCVCLCERKMITVIAIIKMDRVLNVQPPIWLPYSCICLWMRASIYMRPYGLHFSFLHSCKIIYVICDVNTYFCQISNKMCTYFRPSWLAINSLQQCASNRNVLYDNRNGNTKTYTNSKHMHIIFVHPFISRPKIIKIMNACTILGRILI